MTLAVEAVPARVATPSHVQGPIEPSAILPRLPQPVRAESATRATGALFELTLRTDGKNDLAQQLQDAAASANDAIRAAAILRNKLSAEIEAGADFRLGLGPRSADGGRTIESVAFITDVGMERVERRQGGLVEEQALTRAAAIDVGIIESYPDEDDAGHDGFADRDAQLGAVSQRDDCAPLDGAVADPD